jgi:hypothetical protein
MTTSCSPSGRSRSTVPGSQRSSNIALSSASASSRRTVGSPSKKRSAASSCAASIRGIPTFSTAREPLLRTAGATHAQLASLSLKGAASVSDHLTCSSRMVSGSRSSHLLRSAVTRQVEASRAGTISIRLSGWPDPSPEGHTRSLLRTQGFHGVEP